MTERDQQEINSQFWNEGKWNNFVNPFLPDNADGLTLVDMGCNAGLHVKMAEDHGFSQVIGVDSDQEAIVKGNKYRDQIGGKYELRLQRMEDSIDQLPVADYTTFINAHYYFNVADWLDYLDRLRFKTINCIVVTAAKNPVYDHVSSGVEEIRDYFQDWKEYGFVKMGPEHSNETHAREMTSLIFKSKLERVAIDKLDNGNNQQRGFLRQLDGGVPYGKTDYYRRFWSYREHKWTPEKMNKFMKERVSLYQDVKEHGLLKPIVVKKSNLRVVDGNHRADIARHLGIKSIIVRWVL